MHEAWVEALSKHGLEELDRLNVAREVKAVTVVSAYALTDGQKTEIEKKIDISRVEGRVKASSLRKVGEIVDKHPEEAVTILRNWIYQESR